MYSVIINERLVGPTVFVCSCFEAGSALMFDIFKERIVFYATADDSLYHNYTYKYTKNEAFIKDEKGRDVIKMHVVKVIPSPRSIAGKEYK